MGIANLKITFLDFQDREALSPQSLTPLYFIVSIAV